MTSWTKLAAAFQAHQRQHTSTRDATGTRKLVAYSVSDMAIRDALLACSRWRQCWLACCPVCARRRGHRYYTQCLRASLQHYAPGNLRWVPGNLRWVTVNVCQSDSLEAGSALLTGPEHRALKHIIASLRATAWLLRPDGKPMHCQVRVWGAREAEPHVVDGAVTWHWHWHLIVYLDGMLEGRLATALRERWPEPHAVRIDPFRGASPKEHDASVRRLASYPVKARYTYHDAAAGRREWLPPDATDRLARWMVARGSRWPRFQVGR